MRSTRLRSVTIAGSTLACLISLAGPVMALPSTVAAPGAPTALTGFRALHGVGLRWTGDYSGAFPTSYTVYTRPDVGSSWSVLTTLEASQTSSTASYIDGTLANGASALYAVSDSNAGGESAMSSPITLSRPASDPVTGSIDAATADADPAGFLVNEHLDSATGATVAVDSFGYMTATNGNRSMALQLPFVPGPGSYPVGDPNATTPVNLALSTNGNGCNITTGTLDVTDAVYDASLHPVLFTASYAISCDTHPTTYGDIRWNSTADYRDIVASPSSIGPVKVPVATLSSAQSITVDSYGTSSVTLGSATLSGSAASDWAITSDSCSAQSLARGDECQVGVTFTPTTGGDRPALLTIPDNTQRGARTIALEGTGVVAPGTPVTTAREALHRAEIHWNPPASDGGADITTYKLYRWSDGNPQQLIDTVTVTNQGLGGTYDDSGLPTGATYHYGVVAANLAGSGVESDISVSIPHDELLLDASNAITTDGGAPIAVADAAIHGHVAVVPGGRQIVYPGGFNPSSIDIVVANSDGSGAPVRLTTMGGTDPAVSMDGRTVAFVHVNPSTQVPSIWTVPLHGGTPVERVTGFDNPSFLPDGKTLVAEPAPMFEEPHSGAALVRISASGTVTDIPGTTNGHGPAVSPNGQWIAYQLADPSTGVYSLAVIPVGGGTGMSTATQVQQINSISWRTDGGEIFASGTTSEYYQASFDSETGPGPLTGVTPPETSGGPLWPAYINDDAVSLASAPAVTGARPTVIVNAAAGAVTTCSLDGAGASACASSWTPDAALSSGPHTLVVSSIPSVGTASSETWAFTVDATAPTVTTSSPSTLTTTTPSMTVRYAGADANGVASYDVRLRVASATKGYSAYLMPPAWQATTATSESIPTVAGYEYCFSVRARDRVGNVSRWSSDRCTAVPVDDRAFKASKGWSRISGHSFLHHTATTTSTKHKVLSLAGVSARRVLIYATTCNTCGKATVKIGSTSLGVLHLHSAKTVHSVLIKLPLLPSVKKGTLSITVSTSHKPVTIDAVAIRRD